ncbi:sensor histidine kinase [Paenibacillus glufosinatiresistens]|uniref:sensor histidine kinase n=1 Tax=Paenibacillus glufosinatiresistens TaxID=3070657 RepID=UPI00286DBD77|nr:histidine kinase [Paenibacillus sp. YX.27]
MNKALNRESEPWMMGGKAAVLLYVISETYFGTETPGRSWLLLAYLIYLALNIAIPCIPYLPARLLLSGFSAAASAMAALRLDPLFALLIPFNLLELAAASRRPVLGAVVLTAVPVFLLPAGPRPLVLLTGALALLLEQGLRSLSFRLMRLEEREGRLKRDLERVTRSLHENREHLRQSEYTFKLEERNRLSQQIHDELGHAMAGALIQMEAARSLLQSNPAKSGELLGNAIAISREGLEQIRLTLRSNKPQPEEIGIHRLRLLLEELSFNQDISATLSHSGDLEMVTSLQWNVIAQNTTEAVTNALKYSGASSLHLEIQVLNRFVKAVVTDNGRGAGTIAKGLGIRGMEERAARCGGTVIADGSRGFRVTTLLPIGQDAAL